MQVGPSYLTLGRLKTGALGIAIVALMLTLIRAIGSTENFFESYLLSFLFWLGLALGCFVLLLVVHLAGGSWGAIIRRPLEAGVAVIPLMALLFIPLLFGLDQLFSWTDPEYLKSHPTVAIKTGLYLNIPFFIVRAALYFVLWLAGAILFIRLSGQQDNTHLNSGKIAYRMKGFAGVWIVIYILTMTFAATDWAMSLTPVFWSGIYPVILMISQAITGMAFIIIVMSLLSRKLPQINALLTGKRLQDYGNFLMAFTMFWAYTSFSQLIILWSNNVVETASWYVLRLGTGWNIVAGSLLVFGFFAPFLILFSRWVKRKKLTLSLVAVWAIVVQITNIFWFIVPTFARTGIQITTLDITIFIGIGGLWLWVFAHALAARPIIPLNDPRISQVTSNG
jgi:hypothetical protein